MAATNRQQISLDFSEPGNHAGLVHSGQRHGTVLFWEKAALAKQWIKCRPDDDLPAMAQALRGSTDTYFSVNQFNGWRQVKLLRSLRALYVDLDGQLDIELCLDALASAQMPPPSFAIMSGRGIHLYWLLQPTPASALPVWQRMQDALLATLKEVGSDPSCRDCTRVLRLSGTINSKSSTEARGLLLTGQEWDLHSLANEILGYREAKPKAKARVIDFDAAIARKGRKSVLQGSIYGWWHTVYSDLVKLTSLEYQNRVPEGSRDKLLFLHAVALSWFAQPDSIESEILSTGQSITNLTDSEILSTMKPVIDRRNQAEAGHKIKWDGEDRDPRYFFKATTLRSWIGEEVLESNASELRALAPAAVIKERKAERDKSRWTDSYTGTGVKASNEERLAKARLMYASGMTQEAIAQEINRSQKTVSKWLNS